MLRFLERVSVKPNPNSQPIEQRISPSQPDQDLAPKIDPYLKHSHSRKELLEILFHLRSMVTIAADSASQSTATPKPVIKKSTPIAVDSDCALLQSFSHN